MSIWFESEDDINCSLEQVREAIENTGEFFVGIVSLMPGLASVTLVEQDADSVTIKTNEGLMKRTNISSRIEGDRVVLEFDEEYNAGSKVTTNSHFTDEFISSDSGVTHRLVVRDVTAPGLLGFFYRKFGSAKMGKAFLAAHKSYLEK